MDQNHGGEKKWRKYVCNYVICIDIPGNILVFDSNSIIFRHLGLAEDGKWVRLHSQILVIKTFQTFKDTLPAIGRQQCTKCFFLTIIQKKTYVTMHWGKYLSVSVSWFFNSREKVLKNRFKKKC